MTYSIVKDGAIVSSGNPAPRKVGNTYIGSSSDLTDFGYYLESGDKPELGPYQRAVVDTATLDGDTVRVTYRIEDVPPPPVALDVLSVDTWQIDADSTAEAVATYTSNDTVNFVVDGVVVPVEPVDSVATLMISADAPGAIPVQVRAQQFVIIAVEVTP